MRADWIAEAIHERCEALKALLPAIDKDNSQS
jgi:hypothetical protein